MADISKITLPSGTTYDIKDAVARQSIAGGVSFIGISSTAITDGGTEKPTIDGSQMTPINGNMTVYGNSEFIFVGDYGDGGTWAKFGDTGDLGTLAYKNSASGTVTAAGTISQPTFSGNGVRLVTGNISVPTSASFSGNSLTSTGSFTPSGSVSISTGTGTENYTPNGSVSAPTISKSSAGSTTTIKNPTSVTVAKTIATAAPSATAPANAVTMYAVSGETLQLYQVGYTTGASITTSNVTVKTGDASYTATAPTFTGTGVELKGTFSGSSGSVSVSGTPTGDVTLTNSNKTATVSSTTGTVTYTPTGTVTQPTFSGTSVNVTVE